MVRALGQFAAAGLIAMLVLATVGTILLRRAGTAEALHEARVMTQVQEQAARPHITDRLVAGDPAALADFDQAIRLMVLNTRVERVKLWSPDGRVVYADDPRLVGRQFSLGSEEQKTLSTGRPTSDVSNLSAPENRFEPGGHRVLEVYERTRTTSGKPLLFESYLRFDTVSASAQRIWNDFAPALLVTLCTLELLQLPLAWRLIRRLQHGEAERSALHKHAMEASDAERRRIAGDLHDGVVQTLAGVTYSLAAAAADLASSPGPAPTRTAETLSSAASLTRRSMRELRTLLVDIYPPSLRESGLRVALTDLLATLTPRGLSGRLSLDEDLHLPTEVEEVLYRAAQEAVRNVVTHAKATHVEIDVTVRAGLAVLDVRDDGQGFVALAQPGRTSHFGLRLLHEMVGRLDGRLEITSEPGLGTALHLEVPAT